MKKAILAGAAALMLLIGALEASAQIGTAKGTVVTSSTTSVTVKTDDGVQKTYTIDKTSVMPTATLRVGDRVTVDYNTMTAGDMVVTRVTVVPGTNVAVTTTTPSTTTTNYSTTSTNDTYPDTASPEPLLLLVSALGLGAAAGLRRLRRS